MDRPPSELPIVLVDIGPGGVLVEAARGVAVEAAATACVDMGATLGFRMIGGRLCQAVGRIVRHQGQRFAVAFDDINQAMTSFTRQLAKLPPRFQTLYVADILHPRLTLGDH